VPTRLENRAASWPKLILKIMTPIIRLLLLTFLHLLFFSRDSFGQPHTLYVSLQGHDTNPGTKERPLATFEGAKNLIRTVQQPVTVYVREGTYYLQKPVIFRPEDARSAENPVVWKPFPNEKVRISGATALTPKWVAFKKNIVQARIPDGVVADQVFLNGKLLRMARYPNYDPSASHFGGYAEDVLSAQKAASWKNPTGAYIHALHQHEWGGYHYRVTGKDSAGLLQMEGGFQNNRQMGMHSKYRFIEHVFEELDTTDEWYFDQAKRTLFLYADDPTQLRNSLIELPQLSSLFEFRGSEASPITHITIEGFELSHVQRTFMQTKEPLLRSDWAIYRGGAVVMEGAENCVVRACHFNEVGGNGVFFSTYNRHNEVTGCHFEKIGASGVCFVGDPAAVRSPSFEYNEWVEFEKIDRAPGPKSNNYPAQCKVHDNLMERIGQVEKQVAGVQISMASEITVSHNSIYDVPRSGINVSEGTWGGHVIEFNDVFNTVLETGDHGSFNSWGRDRFWHPDRPTMNRIAAENPEIILLDAQKTVVIRNNRFRCDHGWDIDLDDGSSNYHIFNNLCLNGGLKLREGFHRVVENNILVNNSFHPHVWFASSGDVFRRNIVTRPYFPIQLTEWGKEIDHNLFPDADALAAARSNGTDAHSLAGDPLFVAPESGNYQVKPNSPALALGFINFPMDQFGVLSPALRTIARSAPLPPVHASSSGSEHTEISWLGGKLRNVSGLGDRSAYGLPDTVGVIVEALGEGSILSKSPFRKGDVIRRMNGKEVPDVSALLTIYQEINWTGRAKVEVIRNQMPQQFEVHFK
jgi:hypothetical protein